MKDGKEVGLMEECVNDEQIPMWGARCKGGWVNGGWVFRPLEWKTDGEGDRVDG